MALCDDCKLLAIIIRAMGVIKLHIGGFLVSMNFMMSLSGIIITMEQYGYGLMIEGFCFVYQCSLTPFLLVVVLTLTQSQEKFPTVVVIFSSNPESWLVAQYYCLFTKVSQISNLCRPQKLTQAYVGIGLI
jgi:hypothetical protein